MLRITKFWVLIPIAFIFIILLQSCTIIRQIAGTNFDREEFLWDRRAKAAERRHQSAVELSDRISNGADISDADISFILSPEGIEKILKQYENSQGWLDPNTSYVIRKAESKLFMGSADAKLIIEAVNSQYGVKVDLAMNCILSFEQKQEKILIRLEPYDIEPVVKPGGVVSSVADGIISDMVRLNLANVGKQFPDLMVPLDFQNTFTIDKSNITIKDKVNLGLAFPQRKIDYTLKLKEILFFESGIFISMDVQRMEVTK
jgi:hypothetical protein